jgi:hypothetical protein
MKRTTLAFLLFCSCSPSPDPGWHKNGLTVKAVELQNIGGTFAQYRIEVSDGHHSFCYGSGAMGRSGERQDSFRQVIEADHYVFVPASCGGGNASKCRGWQAFRRTDAGNLEWLGYLSGKWDGTQGHPYENGVFYDVGDMLEINELLNHAASPRYVMAYTDTAKNGLSFQAARTWELNAEAYQASADDAAGLLYRAGLAKLCGKGLELKAVQVKAKRLLEASAQKLFAKALARVKSQGVLPNPFIPVGNCPPDGKP